MFTVDAAKTLLALWCSVMDKLLQLISTPYVELYYKYRPDVPIVSNLVDRIIDAIVPPNLTIALVMFGELLILYVVWQFATWVLNLVT